ncbi:DNA gyrase subunit A [Micavibrio aeruginosavorus]|uniref:DNA gyrase subunit A n=1 Tax=Micavibrio aeruginosavorus (strain ARL-13) TaxID=856793 RepID=G2KQL4_MICAA|nr:DNA gyrase subunit A [Micavibrio aeruginosavorus]AEP09942.1 DNA gyrase, A subunit [Micavibrio aeruginosavorus ARL-13]
MTDTATQDPILPTISLEDEMKKSYLDYAMSVIVSRALPDVRDGLKPVHRRIFFAMKEGGYTSDKSYKKSARIVGDVMGKYHPHGDSAIYEAMVRMAQEFSLRLPLIDGQGNFGSMDGDPAAAMRYTEARLAKAAEALLDDIDKDTVEFRPNYDESTMEPTVLPARVPNLLVNGAGGIAVGMATNIPPHNLGEVIDACCAYVANPDVTTEDLMAYIHGPDFPTGAQILGRMGIKSAYMTGNGSIMMRAKCSIEDMRDKREAIIVHEVPYQVNKGRLLERLGEVGREKIVEDMAEIRDESDRDGVRIVIELKKNAIADVVLNQLYKHTQLQTSFPCNMVALNHGRPQTLLLRDFISAFVKFREEVITRRTIYELGKARDRAHVLAGLAVAVANIDEIIAVIRNAPNPGVAKEELLAKRWPAGDVAPLIALIDDPEYLVDDAGTYQMSEIQAKAILDLRLHRLTGLERDKIGDELKEITDAIAEYLAILGSREKLLQVLTNELIEVKTKFGTPRRTEIVNAEFEEDIEDLIQREEMVVTITNSGYAKRVPLDTYRAQRRGGKGRSGTGLKDEDFVTDLFVASTHTPLLCFTSRGIVHKLKVWQLPLGTPQARGKALINMLPLEEGENISVIMRLPEDEEIWDTMDIIFATSKGNVRRNKLSDFRSIRSNGLIAMKLEEEGEKLISVKIAREDDDILLATRLGKAIRFPVDDVRVFSGRTSTGVRGVKLAKDDDEVISMSILTHVEATADERTAYLKMANKLRGADEEGVEFEGGDIQLSESRFKELQEKEQFLLTVTAKGFGKRTSAYEYRLSGRGGQGVTNMALTAKNGGEMIATFPVTDEHEVMLVSDAGQLIRMPVHDVRFTGRSAQGVTLFKVADGEKVVSVAWLIREEGDDAAIDGDVVTPANDTDAPVEE